ncbi:MAG: long-chain fatty acid--CoA ligase [Planctomycetes bacterium]|nr:long-chain fatty acid--CoA ligase [Planctomycetota bacterium]
MTLNVAGRFAEIAGRFAAKTAVNDDAGSFTYAELLARARAVAGRVVTMTDRRRVAVVTPTSAAFPAAFFGILLADRVPVPLNFLLDAAMLGRLARDADFDLVVASRVFERLAAALGLKALFVEDSLPAADPPQPSRGGDDEAMLLYTSGTTGMPKGVVLTHRNLIRNCESSYGHLDIAEGNVFLGLLPFFHSFGITTSMLLPLLRGCSAVYVAKFAPQRVLEALARHGVSIAFAVASMFRALLRAGRPPGLDLSRLRLPIAGGEALGVPLALRFQEVLGLTLLEGYGLTETSPTVAVNVPGRHKLGSVGPMLSWVEACTADDAGQPLPPGAEGELWLRGDCVTPGYHNRPEDTAAAFAPGGWFRTGDLARIDADRFLWITGRKKDLIVSAGEKISPNEVESVLHQHPAVFEAAVIGVPDDTRGEVPKAFVTLREGAKADPSDLAAWCRERLPRYKVPAAFEIRPDLPHGATGKVHKLALRRELGMA